MREREGGGGGGRERKGGGGGGRQTGREGKRLEEIGEGRESDG